MKNKYLRFRFDHPHWHYAIKNSLANLPFSGLTFLVIAWSMHPVQIGV